MKLEQIKSFLASSSEISFALPDGNLVPRHFHVTEVGKVTKDFIDCGGVRRQESLVNFQLWEANDYDHRHHPEKLLAIINKSQDILGIGNEEIEVEYQGESINKYGLEVIDGQLTLTAKQTACLAIDACAVVPEKIKMAISEVANSGCCVGYGCC